MPIPPNGTPSRTNCRNGLGAPSPPVPVSASLRRYPVEKRLVFVSFWCVMASDSPSSLIAMPKGSPGIVMCRELPASFGSEPAV